MHTPPPWLVLLAGAGLVAGGGVLRARRRARPDPFHEGAATRLVGAGLPRPRSARIWVRSDRSGPHTVTLTGPDGVATGTFAVPADPACDGTAVVRWPEDVGAAPLVPGARYRFAVSHADGLVGEGRFRAAPLGPSDAPDHFAIAIASCHQPFTDAGGVRTESLRLLEALGPAFDDRGVEAVLLLGDQMYTDLPSGRCLLDRRYFRAVAPPGRRHLLDCSREEVRALLQERYRIFWKVPAFQRLQARFPVACVLDDHEIVDNAGSDPVHAGPEWANVRAGALDAFHDYQGLRSSDRPRPAAFPTRFAWGPLAGLVLDLRSERVADDERIRILGEGQWALLERFLAEEAYRPVLLIGLSVPLLHVPEWLVEAGALVAPDGSGVDDRWSHPKARADRDRLVRILHAHRRAHPDQQVVLVGGDVHVGAVSELAWEGAPPVLQLVSSAVSNLERELLRFASESVVECRPSFTTADGLCVRARLLPGGGNPCQALNAGVLRLRRDGAHWRVRLELLSHDDDPHGARVVFDSGER